MTGFAIPLNGSGKTPPAVELSSKTMHVRTPRLGRNTLEFPIADIAAVIDLRPDEADMLGLTGDQPLRRPPSIGGLLGGRGHGFTVAVVFGSPQQITAGAARPLGVRGTKGEVATVDALQLSPVDPDELIGALQGARVATRPTLFDAFVEVIGVVDEAAQAAVVSGERLRAVERSFRVTAVALAVPIVVCAVAMVLVDGGLRGQLAILIVIWVVIAAVVGTSMQTDRKRTLRTLGPPA